MDTAYIYGLFDQRDPAIIRYVGWARNVKQRLQQHLRDKKTYLSKVQWIQAVIASGGQVGLIVLEECSLDNWKDRERFWIAKMWAEGHPLTNATSGGQGTVGYVFPEAVRRKLSAIFKGKPRPECSHPHTDETRRKLSELATGRKRSAEAIRKMALVAIGRKHTDEAKRKISESNKGKHSGRVASAETRQKMSDAHLGNKSNTGRKLTEAHCANLSKARIGNQNSLGHKQTDEHRANIGAGSRRAWALRKARAYWSEAT